MTLTLFFGLVYMIAVGFLFGLHVNPLPKPILKVLYEANKTKILIEKKEGSREWLVLPYGYADPEDLESEVKE